MKIAAAIQLFLALTFVACYAHQMFYVFYTLFKKPPVYPPSSQINRYAILICARNEEHVIGYLLDSIKRQDYPAGQMAVFVCADNCTDGTAAVARSLGAQVLERRDSRRVGKGYALEALISYVWDLYGADAFDGYLVVDADNLLDHGYVAEMDRCFSAGHRVVVGYRAAKNFGENWLASGYALWFYREARQLNCARTLLGVSGAVSGTGFLVHKEILKSLGGWPYHLLTEDVEFSADMVLRGEKIAYCHNAVLYDEHPVSFAVSWAQRLRWAMGYRQVLRRYGRRLCRAALTHKGHRFSAFDLLMNIAPAYILTTVSSLFYGGGILLCVWRYPAGLLTLLGSLAAILVGSYLLLFWAGVTVLMTERQRIRGTGWQKTVAAVTFPLFMMTFVPIGIAALCRRHVAWKPTAHRIGVSVEDMGK